mgnify:CR=1 FL=1
MFKLKIGMCMKHTMWSQEDLQKISVSDDLHISPLREDGKSYGTPTWIWSVVVDENLYVRAYHGEHSSWYKAALRQKAGQINVSGMTLKVSFAPMMEKELNDRIDEAYIAKYKGNPYLDSMISAKARAATIKILPQSS